MDALHIFEPPAHADWTVQDVLLAGRFFIPLSHGYFTAEHLTEFYEGSVVEFDAAVRLFLERRLIREHTDRGSVVMYGATPAGWAAREKFLVLKGLRHVAPANQRKCSLHDLIVAVAAAPRVDNELCKSLLGQQEAASFEELYIYLRDYDHAAIDAAISDLVADERHLARWAMKKDRQLKDCSAIRLTPAGYKHYQGAVRDSLHIPLDRSILSFDPRRALGIFWAWQSEYALSRSLFSKALEETIYRINRDCSLALPVNLVVAGSPGEGAIRIDAEIERKIKEASYFCWRSNRSIPIR